MVLEKSKPTYHYRFTLIVKSVIYRHIKNSVPEEIKTQKKVKFPQFLLILVNFSGRWQVRNCSKFFGTRYRCNLLDKAWRPVIFWNIYNLLRALVFLSILQEIY